MALTDTLKSWLKTGIKALGSLMGTGLKGLFNAAGGAARKRLQATQTAQLTQGVPSESQLRNLKQRQQQLSKKIRSDQARINKQRRLINKEKAKLRDIKKTFKDGKQKRSQALAQKRKELLALNKQRNKNRDTRDERRIKALEALPSPPQTPPSGPPRP